MEPKTIPPGSPTQGAGYFKRLLTIQDAWWRRFFNVQAPYGWNIRRLNLGFTLDIGCGLGRYLRHLNGNGVGIDHNATSIQYARSQGLTVFTPEEFQKSEFNKPQRFDSILLSHVAEHMTQKQTIELLDLYAPFLKPEGKLVLITPQEAGFKKDATHREFMDFRKLREIAETLRFRVVKEYSFPLPRFWGRFFYFNEFISVSVKIPQ